SVDQRGALCAVPAALSFSAALQFRTEMTAASTVALAAVIVFFLFSIATVPIIAWSEIPAGNNRRWLIVSLVFSVIAKIIVATVGYKGDIESYRTFAHVIEQGKNIYGNINNYNYALVWAWILAGLDRFALFLRLEDEQGFRLVVVLFLATIDALIA